LVTGGTGATCRTKDSEKGRTDMNEERVMAEQQKLNDEVRKHMVCMKWIWFWVRYAACMALILGGFFCLARTKGAFGDVPMVLGVVAFLRLMKA